MEDTEDTKTINVAQFQLSQYLLKHLYVNYIYFCLAAHTISVFYIIIL